jgi:hypothetical protein
VSLYYIDPVGCHVNLTDFDFLSLLEPGRAKEMRRAVARLVYLMAKQKLIPVPSFSEFCLAYADDQWVLSFLLATLALKFPLPKNLSELRNDDFSGHYEGAQMIVPVLFTQFERGHGTAASRFYASIILERMAHSEPEIDSIAKRDFEHVVRCLLAHCPHDDEDKRPETAVAVHLSSVLLRIWRKWHTINEPNHAVLFSQVLMPLFDVVGIKNHTQNDSNLTTVQLIFLEILRHIAAFDDLVTSIKSEQMQDILREFASGNGTLAAEAQQTLDALNR